MNKGIINTEKLEHQRLTDVIVHTLRQQDPDKTIPPAAWRVAEVLAAHIAATNQRIDKLERLTSGLQRFGGPHG
jgi:hypothetical protein